MKSLRFQKLYLCSELEKRAKTVSFDPRVTVILGENDTGKSSLIKSIYAAFGADPPMTHPKWVGANVTILVDFTIDGIAHRILRSGEFFALFDGHSRLLWKESGISSGVAVAMARLLDFKLELQNRQGEFVTPAPAYGFLPFYVDQDAGWQKTWSSFAGLGQFENFKTDAANFHAGLRPNEYYAAKADKQTADRAKEEFKVERRALDRAAKRLQANRRSLKFDLQPDVFGERLDELFLRCQALQNDQEKVQRALTDLHSQRAILLEQIHVASRALSELDEDYEFLRETVDAQVICPTCGTAHENDFANKFGLIGDADLCRGFLLEAKAGLAQVDVLIGERRGMFESFADQISEIQLLLDEQRGEVKLRDLIEGESERLVDSAIASERALLDEEVGKLDSKSDEALAVMKSFDDAKHKKRVMDFYRGKMADFLIRLRVPGLLPKDYKRIDCSIKETGSDLPRAILAYNYAFLHTMHKFGGKVSCPIVMDSPVQQDQDPDNAARIIEFALTASPEGSQLILGTVSLHGAAHAGRSETTIDEYSLLNRDEYASVQGEMAPLFRQMLG
jgi:hypothetical protein